MKWLYLYGVLAGLGLSGCEAVAHATPDQTPNAVASTSLCGDGYMQAFAPDHIAALSWQSKSDLSLAIEAQKNLPQIDASLERLLSQKDTLILFGPGEGYQVSEHLPQSVTLNWTETFEGVEQNAKAILKALNASFDKFTQWQADVENTRLKGLAIEKALSSRILYLTPSGGSAGPNTFVDAAIELAGGKNINQTAGWHSPNIETLIQYNPDIIIMSFSDTAYHSRSHIMSPVVERFLNDKTVITVDGAYWPCAGPYLFEATKIIQKGILDWQADQDV